MPTIECPELATLERDLRALLPGGVLLQVQIPSIDVSGIELALQMMQQLSSAAAPLTPVFNIIGAVLAIKEFTDTFTSFPPDPTALANAIQEIIEKTAALAQLVPQLSVPLMVLGMLDAILALLAGIIEELEALVALQERIANAQLIVDLTGNEALLEAISCAQSLLGARQTNLENALGPASTFIGLINAFGELIPGFPVVPDIGELPPDAGDAIDAVEDLITLLQAVRDTIPI